MENSWRDWLTRLWQQDRSLVLRLLIVGSIGVALVAIGSLAHAPASTYAPPARPPVASTGDVLDQQEGVLAGQVDTLVAAIPGAGRVTAMVTLARSIVTEYAHGAGGAPLAESKPSILGVVVVASGAGNPAVRQEITAAVETLLQIEPYQVLVLPNGGGS